jgi:histidinol phosphatase-like PHP family hydrolase
LLIIKDLRLLERLHFGYNRLHFEAVFGVQDKGVKCAINCDADWVEDAGHLRLGAGLARKGWLEKKDMGNTLAQWQILNFRP